MGPGPGRIRYTDYREEAQTTTAANQDTEDLTDDRPSKKLEKALNATLSKLTNGESGPSQLAELDPDKTRWNVFRASVQDLFDRSKDDLLPAQKDRYEQLCTKLKAESGLSNTTNQFYFEFLDEALKARGLDIVTAMSKNNNVDLRYPTEWYPDARSMQRDIHLHIGPTNSGKTYAALKRLETATSGFYAGPLRLLAHEVYSRLNSSGFTCDLITGDDVRIELGTEEQPRYSSTVEMVNVGKEVEVGVIDEIQMIADKDRGWAWTRALLGSCAKELHLCGEPRVLPLIRELAASMGDNLHIHRYERLNPLRVERESLRGDFKKLRKGDCVVTFSIMEIHALRKTIEVQSGKRVAIVYGSLPPETRASQAALFNDPDNDYDYLVASDAIGMGLNLAIRRIVFDAVTKFDGVSRKQLSIPQIKQIAGRAGRYRTSHDDLQVKKLDAAKPNRKGDSSNVGFVTCVDEQDLPIIRDALTREAPPVRQAGLLPPGDFIVAYADRIPLGVSHDYVVQRLCDAASVHPRFSLCMIREQVTIARAIESIRELTTSERCTFTASPANAKTPLEKSILKALARAVADKKQVSVVDLAPIPLEVLEYPLNPTKAYLRQLEDLHKALIIFLWLSYRFSTIFMDQDMAFHAKKLTEDKINMYLKSFSANKSIERRLRALRRKEERALMPKTAVPDWSEHATEDLVEEDAGDIEQAEEVMEGKRERISNDESALPVDWSRNQDGIDEVAYDESERPRGQAVGAGG